MNTQNAENENNELEIIKEHFKNSYKSIYKIQAGLRYLLDRLESAERAGITETYMLELMRKCEIIDIYKKHFDDISENTREIYNISRKRT